MQNRITTYLLICTGWLAIILGIAGIILPLLPTTPFILLAAACFAKSSPKFHHWLVSHPFFGPIIASYKDGKSIPPKVKMKVILLIWFTLSISIYLLEPIWLRSGLFLLGVFFTVHLWRKPVTTEPFIESPTE